VKWNTGDKPEDQQGFEVSETIIAFKLSAKDICFGRDEKMNVTMEGIVMPCVKVLSVSLPGRNEETTSPSFSIAINLFFLLSAIL
jgi:hypothetical protein